MRTQHACHSRSIIISGQKESYQFQCYKKKSFFFLHSVTKKVVNFLFFIFLKADLFDITITKNITR